MVAPRPSKTRVGTRTLSPETLMLSYGYDPMLSEGAVKPPIFLTSTFVFRTAEEGRDFFDYMAGRRQPPEGTGVGLVYSRFNHPNSEIVEDRLAIYEGAETCILLSSGMAAIATTVLAYARPSDVLLHSQPLYGGTETFIANTLAQLGIGAVGFADGVNRASVEAAADEAATKGRVSVILVETPSNPTNTLVDLGLVSSIGDALARRQGHRPIIVCDNTLLGPVFQRPLTQGADLSVYSLTKYVGGHSDLIAGAVLGRKTLIQPIKVLRSSIGTQLDPHSCWMIGRSLETLSLRMERADRNAHRVAEYLRGHPKVAKVHYPPFLEPGSAERVVFERQSTGAGSTFSFDIIGGQAEAFAFLNALQVFKLAVSLGGTESLASHPAAMTHSGIPPEIRARIGVLETTIRLSVGIENADDLIADVEQALGRVPG